MTSIKWKTLDEAATSPAVWGAALQLAGTVMIAWGFDVAAATGVEFFGKPAAAVTVDAPVLLQVGWLCLATGMLLQIVAAWLREPPRSTTGKQ